MRSGHVWQLSNKAQLIIGQIVLNADSFFTLRYSDKLVMEMQLRIRDLREDADLTQKQVASYLLCDQSLYSKYERGDRPLPLDYAVKLAGLYSTSVDYIVGLTNVRKPYP